MAGAPCLAGFARAPAARRQCAEGRCLPRRRRRWRVACTYRRRCRALPVWRLVDPAAMTTQTTIAIDAGNTRLKWGVRDGTRWVERGALPTGEAARLARLRTAAGWPAGAPVVACCVAGKLVEDEIANVLAGRFPLVRWLRSSAEACGVRNHYEEPARLGADRWAAMLGARGICAGRVPRHLRRYGDDRRLARRRRRVSRWTDPSWRRPDAFLVGAQHGAAALRRRPLPASRRATPPDAIFSGCLYAQIGAVERMYAAMRDESEVLCLLTGGAAPCLAPHLSVPFQLMENLILDGLVRYGAST
jgi:type III pantothenate kinase